MIKRALQYIIKFKAHYGIIHNPQWDSRMLVVTDQRWDMVCTKSSDFLQIHTKQDIHPLTRNISKFRNNLYLSKNSKTQQPIQ